MSAPCSAVVIGVGPEQGLGAALAKHAAAQGLHVFIAGRSEDKLQQVAETITRQGGQVTAVVADATLEQDVERLFAAIRQQAYPLDIAVYNVDSNCPAPILETDSEMFTRLWQQNCFGGFLFGKHALSIMHQQRQGTLIFTGATASLRAKPPFTAFAAAKAGLRALAQGMAREFGPQGVHVVHTIIDGVINGDRARTQFADYVAAKGDDGLLQLDAIVQTYWALHQQHPSAWTQELDLRPYKEPF
ncbi:MAG: SDR family NAD(P)-dependent oxidoreductase [Methylococcaceae bacterium]|nr:SDR family NAD(P)-dependent oxidoreductase [Methylococcaceae bacterium]